MNSDPLKQLKKRLQMESSHPKPAPKPKPVSENPRYDDNVDDATLFARATQGVKRIYSEAPVAPIRKKTDGNVLIKRASLQESSGNQHAISDSAALMFDAKPEEFLSYARNGIPPRRVQKLKLGTDPWQAAVDLHGCSTDQARDAVLSIINNGYQEGLQIIKIVHGKSHEKDKSLLKSYVNGWLRQIPEVLAFVSSLPRDGGTGALYVLLKRKRSDSDADELS